MIHFIWRIVSSTKHGSWKWTEISKDQTTRSMLHVARVWQHTNCSFNAPWANLGALYGAAQGCGLRISRKSNPSRGRHFNAHPRIQVELRIVRIRTYIIILIQVHSFLISSDLSFAHFCTSDESLKLKPYSRGLEHEKGRSSDERMKYIVRDVHAHVTCDCRLWKWAWSSKSSLYLLLYPFIS